MSLANQIARQFDKLAHFVQTKGEQLVPAGFVGSALFLGFSALVTNNMDSFASGNFTTAGLATGLSAAALALYTMIKPNISGANVNTMSNQRLTGHITEAIKYVGRDATVEAVKMYTSKMTTERLDSFLAYLDSPKTLGSEQSYTSKITSDIVGEAGVVEKRSELQLQRAQIRSLSM